MTFGQIKCFMTVAAEQRFAKAASVLYISQPAVSKSVAKLEEELGFSLIDRHGNDLTLTPAGRMLYDLFAKTESDYQDTLLRIRQFISASAQTVHLGCPETWDPDRFYGRITEHFRASAPAVALEIESYQMSELFSRLQADKLDFILTYESQRPLQYGYTVRLLADASSGLLYSRAHHGTLRSLSELGDLSILTFDTPQIEKKFSRTIKRVCNSFGVDPEIRTCPSFISAMFSMSCGDGAVLLTDWENVERSERYGFLPLPNSASVNLVYMNSADKPYRKLIAGEIVSLFKDARGRAAADEKTPDPFFT